MKRINLFLSVSLLVTIGDLAAQNPLKPVQKRAVLNLLAVYETNVNALVPKLAASKGKAATGLADFQKSLFVSDRSQIYNHVAVNNLQLDSTTTARMKQDFLSPQDFLRLCAGVFKRDFVYKLNFEQVTIVSPNAPTDSSSKDIVTSRLAQVYIPVQIEGANGALQIKQADSLRIDIEFVVTSLRNVIPARILRIVKAVGGPKPSEEPIVPTNTTQGVKAKVDSLLNLIAGLTSARDTQAVQYQVYQRLLPRLVAQEGRYHIRLSKDTTERKIYATSFARIDSLRHRKFQFEKALVAYVTFTESAPNKPKHVTTEYFFGTTFKGQEIQYLKNYKVTEETSQPRFSHPGWWIDEVWLKESVPKKVKPPVKDSLPIK